MQAVLLNVDYAKHADNRRLIVLVLKSYKSPFVSVFRSD